jgi:hypothetical protein
MKRIAIWTTYYTPKTEERDSEFIRCLKINSENPHIDVMYVLCENTPCPIESDKLKVITISERPSFNTFFGLYSSNEPNSINLLINTDIVIDYDETPLFQRLQNNIVFMLTRYEVMFPDRITSIDDLKTERIDLLRGDETHVQNQFYGSYDLWAICGSPSSLIFPELLGVPACDGRVAFHFNSLGYRLYNPCLVIHTYHIHSDKDRSYYMSRYAGDTVHIRPTNLCAMRNPEINQAAICVDESIPRPTKPTSRYSIVSQLNMRL